jgi:hypothetical protein
MSTATDEISFGVTAIPRDVTPSTDPEPDTGPYDSRYPDSTPEAPYGYKPNGEPYKRHHSGHGSRGSGTGSRMPATEKQAETAAALLARLNTIFGFVLTAAGMPESAATLAANNVMFESMAKQALETDPALCRKILSAGATSGKAGLIMAYAMLGMGTFPDMKREYRENHPKELEEGAAFNGDA